MQKIENGLKYVIPSLGVCCNDLWLFPFKNKTLCDLFNDIKMIAEVKFASA